MKVLVTGASGLIGSALTTLLRTRGHGVASLVRASADPARGTFAWDPYAGEIDVAAFEGVDALVHLSGESVAGRWSEAKKRRIRESRVRTTKLLAETLGRLERPPGTFVCASAVGYYGDRGDEPLTEESPPGEGFLAEVVEAWEREARAASAARARVVNVRFGIVLAGRGGALATLLRPFRLGLGGRLGDGRQFMSWISIDDAAGALLHALEDARLDGPVNAVAPNAVRNVDFTRTLARVLHRPARFAVPALALRAVLGEAARDLLASQRAVPAVLERSGYDFRYGTLEGALRHVLAER
jgi:uncharacterized protein (TIGR01777 family)